MTQLLLPDIEAIPYDSMSFAMNNSISWLFCVHCRLSEQCICIEQSYLSTFRRGDRLNYRNSMNIWKYRTMLMAAYACILSNLIQSFQIWMWKETKHKRKVIAHNKKKNKQTKRLHLEYLGFTLIFCCRLFCVLNNLHTHRAVKRSNQMSTAHALWLINAI